MAKVTSPGKGIDWDDFRDCRIPDCGRRPRPDSPYCESHYKQVIRDALDYARRPALPGEDPYGLATDDGGHNDV